MVEVIVPTALFLTIFGIVAVVVYFRYRSQSELQETIRTVLQSGQAVSEETLAELVSALTPGENDKRRGIISIAIALAIGVLAFAVDEGDAVYPLLGIAAFPLFLGLAYFLLYAMGKGDNRSAVS